MSSWGRADVSVEITGIKELSKSAVKLGVSLSDMTKFNYRLAQPIAARARQLAPYSGSGKKGGPHMRSGIRPVRSKNKVSVRMGNSTTLVYAAVVHWGRDGSSGPKFLSVAEEQLRAQTLSNYDIEMKRLLKEHGWM